MWWTNTNHTHVIRECPLVLAGVGPGFHPHSKKERKRMKRKKRKEEKKRKKERGREKEESKSLAIPPQMFFQHGLLS